jgi:serine/threonine kinase 16
MDAWKKSFSSAWDSVSARLPLVQDQLAQLGQRARQELSPWLPGGGSNGEVVTLGPRRLKIVRKLAEGGYSFVYLAEELADRGPQPDDWRPRSFALKKVLVADREHLLEARREAETTRSLDHPNLLPLLDSAFVPGDPSSPRRAHPAFYFLFDLWDGNLWDEVQTRVQNGDPLAVTEALWVFVQLCRGLEAMHSADPPLAHRDVKPHNLLVTTQRGGGGGKGGKGYKVALMDFGSAAPAVQEVNNRQEAVALEEEAARLCSAPYRAPELWDVPSTCRIDQRVDVWAAGCVLYYACCGESPFERAANASGGSLRLAVVK